MKLLISKLFTDFLQFFQLQQKLGDQFKKNFPALKTFGLTTVMNDFDNYELYDMGLFFTQQHDIKTWLLYTRCLCLLSPALLARHRPFPQTTTLWSYQVNNIINCYMLRFTSFRVTLIIMSVLIFELFTAKYEGEATSPDFYFLIDGLEMEKC